MRPALKLPKWPFIGADAALISAVVYLVVTRPQALGFGFGFVLFLLVASAASILILPFFLEFSDAARLPGISRLPKWIISNEASDEKHRQLVVHLHLPHFVGEVTTSETGEEEIRPLWIDDSVMAQPAAVAYLVREAGEFHRGVKIKRSVDLYPKPI